MKTNNQKKPKNQIFIIWVLFISAFILVITILFLLILKPTISNLKKQETLSNVKTETQKEQETYNIILNKIEKQIDKLTQQQEQTSLLKFPPKIIFFVDKDKINVMEEYNQDTGKLIKKNSFREYGKTIYFISEYNQELGKLIQQTNFNPDGIVKEIKTY